MSKNKANINAVDKEGNSILHYAIRNEKIEILEYILKLDIDKYKVDNDGLDNILIYLERQEYISIKYDDDGVYCLCVLPFGNEVLEDEHYKKREGFSPPRLWLFILVIFISCLFSTILSQLLVNILLPK